MNCLQEWSYLWDVKDIFASLQTSIFSEQQHLQMTSHTDVNMKPRQSEEGLYTSYDDIPFSNRSGCRKLHLPGAVYPAALHAC